MTGHFSDVTVSRLVTGDCQPEWMAEIVFKMCVTGCMLEPEDDTGGIGSRLVKQLKGIWRSQTLLQGVVSFKFCCLIPGLHYFGNSQNLRIQLSFLPQFLYFGAMNILLVYFHPAYWL